MNRIPTSLRTWAFQGLFLALLLSAVALLAQEGKEKKDGAERLGGAERALAFVSVDKPMYRVGETVWGRAVVVDAHTRAPLKTQPLAVFEVVSPRGEKSVIQGSLVDGGVAAFRWTVPEGTPGGEYALIARFPREGFAPAQRSFDVRAYRVPRFRTQILFAKKGYGPGEKVSATLSALLAEGGAPAGAAVAVQARVDGAEVFRGEAKLDDKGQCAVQFALPAEIAEGEGSLTFVIRHGGVVESAAQTIPILLNRVMVRFYPEGGDLVAGLEGRVYCEARDPRQKPADVAGRVLGPDGKAEAEFSTVHEGRGSFTFTPKTGGVYTAVLDRPAGNTQRFLLPQAKESGVALRSAARVFDAAQPLRFSIASTAPRMVKLAVCRLEKEIASASAALEPGALRIVSVELPAEACGVLRATVFDDAGLPLAERLVFRRPLHEVKVEVKAAPDNGVPGAPIALEILTTGEDGKPVAATVGLAVTDDAVLEKIEKREQAPRLPEQVLLESEVRELGDAHVYLARDDASQAALDLLLGTQGWRRFAFADPEAFLSNQGDFGKRVLAYRAKPEPVVLELDDEDWVEEERAEGGKPEAPGAVEKKAAGKGGEAPQGKAAPAEDAARDQPADKRAPGAERRAVEKERAAAGFIPDMKRQRSLAVVREYAHRAAADRDPAQRTDFAETVYWHAGLKTDAEGKAKVSFDLSDSITTFRVRADAISDSGALGEADALIVSRKAFYLEPKLPLEITAGDVVEVPVALVNGTNAALQARLKAELGQGLLLEGAEPQIALAAGASGRLYLTLVGAPHNGTATVALSADAGAHSDRVTREIAVAPFGFPIDAAFGGTLSGSARGEVEIPASVVPASVVARAAVYPSPLATLTDALKGLLREPGGCFEQTSSTAYPNVMVMNYFESHRVADAELMGRCRDLLDKGYKRLVGFECKQKGYEWFGGDPGHEALTAYGLMEFSDMAKVYPVDAPMRERTRAWLLSRKDGKGGFQRNPRALDSFGGAPQDITNAYIVWALLESGEKGLEAEVAGVKAAAAASDDPYLLALSANILLLAGDGPGAEALLAKAAAKQDAEGAVRGAATSITRSGGDTLVIETTSLAILGWLRVPRFAGNVEKAADWLFRMCKGGRFGSTQSTILALRAILGYDASRARPKAPGTARLLVDGKEVAALPFTPETQGALEFPAFADRLAPGKHSIEVKMDGGSEMPYAVAVRFHAATPANGPECKVRLATSLAAAEAKEGETLEAKVRLENRTEEGIPMTLAIVGLPGGLEPRHDQLKELVKQGKADFYEVIGREVVLYWRSLEPLAVREATLSLTAAVPGTYTGPASRAYLYYTDDQKIWCPGLKVKVRRSGE